MTTTIASPSPHDLIGTPSIGGNRIWNVVRLGWINRWTVLWIPAMILAFILVVNISIWALIVANTAPVDRADALAGTQFTGATTYVFAYLMVISIQAINLTFPYALGLSVTRREFSLGTAISLVLLSALWGGILTVLSYVEQWTNGWWLGGHMFTVVYFGNGPVWERLFVFVGLFLFFAFFGIAWGTVYMRWRVYGMYVMGGVLALATAGGIALLTLNHAWGDFWNWFATAGPVGVVAWMLLVAAVSAVAGYFILRRATPKL
ncbi:hypothetical protein ACL9RL_08990 [Plantibacter sp. Mn2098]|uniref:hypothetical protein n=1 Tax=Plantibacter sp. Mn2098 TaxID=3395266 RepID=UPI003BDD707F